jgi:biotin synthase
LLRLCENNHTVFDGRYGKLIHRKIVSEVTQEGGGGSVERLLNKLVEQGHLDREEIVYFLHHLDPPTRQRLCRISHQKRLEFYGRDVFLRGLIEFSNYCKQDCLYCGIRASNRTAQRYRLTYDEILQCCEEGYRLGYRTFVMQSGEDFSYSDSELARLIMTVKSLYPDTAVTLSIGERSEEVYRTLFVAGADRYLLRHETASRRLYEALHPTMSYDNRIRCLWTLKRIGYQVGAGFMVGLPGQTAEDLAEDLLFLKELQPDMIGIGPFIPHSETPLGWASGGTLEDTLTMIALARLFVPESLIPATTAIGTVHPQGRELALKAGANVVMPNLSPLAVRRKYELYNNKICTGEESAQCKFCIERRIEAAGFIANGGRGDSVRFSCENIHVL